MGRAAFLLVVVWWAWIYTTSMVNWFDPRSLVVRGVLLGVALASLLMSAAIPTALTGHAALFAGASVALSGSGSPSTRSIEPAGVEPDRHD
jgi:low temperature requirement protein LtrA